MRDDKFYDRVKYIILFKKLDDSYISLKELTEAEQKEVFYVTDKEAQNQYITLLKEENIDPVLLNNMIDNHFSSFLEYKISDISFKRVDSYVSENLKDNTEDNEELDKNIKTLFEKYAPGAQISVERLKSERISAMYVLSEEARRMEEMQKLYGGINIPNMPKPEETLIINSNNELVKNVLNLEDGKVKDIICANVIDMAKLSHNTLNGDEKTAFLQRNIDIMNLLMK